MAGLRDGIDVTAALQLPYIFLSAQHGRDVEPVVRQAVTRQYISPLRANRVQLAFGGGDEVGYGMGQFVHDVVIAGLDLHQPAPHRCRIGTVLRRVRQPDTGRHLVLA